MQCKSASARHRKKRGMMATGIETPHRRKDVIAAVHASHNSVEESRYGYYTGVKDFPTSTRPASKSEGPEKYGDREEK